MQKTLKEHRLNRHLSQSELAAQSGISIRTIQRIENGESTGSPYVIRTLCKSLDIDPEHLIVNPEPHVTEKLIQPKESDEDRTRDKNAYDTRLKYINFSALSVLGFPFLNLVLPAVLYFVFKKSLWHAHDKNAALKILSLHILWSVFTLVLMIFIPLIDHLFFGIEEVMEIPLFIWIYLVLVITLVVIILHTASDINKRKNLLIFIPNIL